MGYRKLNSQISTDRIGATFVAELRNSSDSDRQIFESLYHELRRIARAKMRRERPDHTLQATALVNEAFLKVFRTPLPPDFWDDPTRAVRFIANAMEQILNDYADAHRALKRGGDLKRRVPIDQHQGQEFAASFTPADHALSVEPEQSETVLGIRECLGILRKRSPRQAEILQLHFYGGLTYEEIAAALNVSVETVKLDLRRAKAFMKVHLSGTSGRQSV